MACSYHCRGRLIEKKKIMKKEHYNFRRCKVRPLCLRIRNLRAFSLRLSFFPIPGPIVATFSSARAGVNAQKKEHTIPNTFHL